MVDLTWGQIYDTAVHEFAGQEPTRALETDLINAYTTRPAAVLAAIQKAADRYKAGKAHSPWGIVKAELDRDTERSEIRPGTQDADRDRQIRLAETWIRNAGLYMPDQTSLIDELFGDRGRLRPWPELTDRIVSLWEHERPRAQLAHDQSRERANAIRKQRHPEPAPEPNLDAIFGP